MTVTDGAGEAPTTDASSEIPMDAPFWVHEVFGALFYEGALVTREHARDALRAAAACKAWAAAAAAWDKELRREVVRGGWGPVLHSFRKGGHYEISLTSGHSEVKLPAFAVRMPAAACFLLRGVERGLPAFDVLDAFAATFVDAESGHYGREDEAGGARAMCKIMTVLTARNCKKLLFRNRADVFAEPMPPAGRPLPEDLDSLGVRALKKLAGERGVDTSGCVEKSDILEALRAAHDAAAGGVGKAKALDDLRFDFDKRLILRQATMDSINTLYFPHPGLGPWALDAVPPPFTSGVLKFFLSWFGSETSWPLQRGNVLETLYAFRGADLDLARLTDCEAARWRLIKDEFPAQPHGSILATYAAWAAHAKRDPTRAPVDCDAVTGDNDDLQARLEGHYNSMLVLEARARKITSSPDPPLWYGENNLLKKDAAEAGRGALALEMGAGGGCSIM